MRSIVLAFVLLLALPSLAFAQRGDYGASKAGALRAELGVVLSEIRDEVRAIDDLLEAAGSAGVQREIARKLARVDELSVVADELGGRLARAADHGAGHRPDGPPPAVIVVQPTEPVFVPGNEPVVIIDAGPVACSGGDFNSLLAAVDDESFRDGKLQVLRDASAHRWFNVDQVIRFMEAMSFGDDKVEAAAMLHGRTVDLENWYRVYGALTFDSNKNELRKRVGG
ncbi:MAG: DUF4476 domain-containing protein [Deltaproteobacteria bacterium]|nr:DUF4476 domain-containing protein [Deltaproteobacteria bacterium]